MELYLLSSTKISEAKKQFNFYFPNLQLSFNQASITPVRNEVRPDLVLLQLPWFREGVFSLDPKMSVADFEEAIYRQHGLQVTVQVRLNGTWTEALTIANLSLEAQNAMGKMRTVKFHLNPATLFL